MKKIVYVTGCLGLIGAYVTQACLEQEWYVIGVDKMTYAAQPGVLDVFRTYDTFKFIHSDINDLETLLECDYVINCAAETHVDNSIISSDEFLHSNIDGVKHLLELIRKKSKFDKPTLLHFSTDEVYGDISEGSHTEEHLLKPSNPYSATKAAADMLIHAWARTFNVPYIIVRPTNNYGRGQYIEKLIPRTCKSLILGKKVPLHNNGNPKRMWLHAADTAQAIITIINKNVRNEIFNISGNIELSNIEIVKKVYDAYLDLKGETAGDNWKELICDFTYHRLGQDVRYSLDDSKLRKLGWDNKCNLDKEIKYVVRYYMSNFIW